MNISKTCCRVWLGLAALMMAASVASDDRAALRRDVSEGELVSLAAIFDRLESCYEGQILEAEFESNHGAPRYEVEMMGPDGQIAEFGFDAASGALRQLEGVNLSGMRKEGVQWPASGAECESTTD